MTHTLSACLVLLVSTSASGALAQSLGHFHMPSTLPQFCGLGYGAGHHAPMIRPMQCQPPRMQRFLRMPGCGACGAMPLESFPTCGTHGCHAQLDQLMGADDYDHSPVTTERPTAAAEESILPESPLLPMLPEP